MVLGFILACGGPAKVEVGELQLYTHPDGLFTIEVPENWQSQDMSSGNMTRVMVTDPKQNAALAIVIIPTEGRQVDQSDLPDLLKQDVQSAFGGEANFVMQEPSPQADGSVRQQFTYESQSGDMTAPMVGSGRIRLEGSNVLLVYSVLPDNQAEELNPQIETMISSLSVDRGSEVATQPTPTMAAMAPSSTPSGRMSGEMATPPTPTSAAMVPSPTNGDMGDRMGDRDEMDDSGAEGGGGELAPVVIGSLETYEHPTGIFSIDVPENWNENDLSNEGMTRVFFTGPKENAMVAVIVIPTDGSVVQEDLNDLLIKDIDNTFGDEDNFAAGEPKEQNDGSIGIVFTYNTMVGSIEAEMLGNGFIQLDGSNVTLLYVIVPSDQFDDLVSNTNEIINSLRVVQGEGEGDGGSGDIGSSAPDGATDGDTDSDTDGDTGIFANMQTYQYPTGLFSLEIPAAWTVQENVSSELVTMMWFSEASNFDDFAMVGVILVNSPVELSQDEITELLEEQISSSAFGSYEGFEMSEPEPQTDGSILLPFGYVESGTPLSGYAYGEQRGDKFSVLMLIASEEQFANHWETGFSQIANSYTIDPSASLQ